MLKNSIKLFILFIFLFSCTNAGEKKNLFDMTNMEIAFLTPPFGMTLFVLRGILKPPLSMGDLYRAALPFIAVQAVGLAIMLLFPKLSLILPALVVR